MINHSTLNLILIRISISLFQYAPLIEAILLLSLLHGAVHHAKPILSSWPIILLTSLLTLEATYYLTLYQPHKSRLLQTKATHPHPPLTRAQRQAIFDKCAANIPNWESYLRGWFLNAPLSDIKHDNLREFLLWAFFDHDNDSFSSTLDPDSESHLASLVSHIETSLNHKFPPGRGPATTKSLRLTIDPVSTKYHSVLWYFIIALTDAITHLHLRYHGFAYHTPPKSAQSSFPPRLSHLPWGQNPSPARSTSYYFRPQQQTSPSKLPVVFLHGIGIGLWPYTSFLSSLPSSSGILALEVLPISSRLTSPPLSKPQFLSELSTILSSLGWEDFILVTHSYGSVLATHMLHTPSLSQRIKGLVLIDPVTILLHLPSVAYNFTRRQPKKANEHQLHYFASTDLGIAEGLGRYFFWRENIIWKEELLGDNGTTKRKVAVCLAGRDLIVDTKSVARYLASEKKGLRDLVDVGGGLGGDEDEYTRLVLNGEGDNSYLAPSGIEIHWFQNLDHAQVFDEDLNRVLGIVSRFCQV
ncbi:hypothetical protein QBC38DRAFT_478180 [Podospora fimiseda]|uniref:AB hydrolase-1 domain-containing protein n=1 Tax=Podospora fimiseda TaxID=252190 RepID=A0AAN7BPV0_9PEZI|nr:hypothetical protein QBC38DRAFT_478180 [Podospora fimiseda]